jgi:mRNA interferase MazF
MPSTTNCSFGDVTLVPFPFTDQSTTKKRPAVVVSSAEYHRTTSDVIVMAVTSKTIASSTGGDVRFRQWQEAGLKRPSQLKPILATLDRSLVVRKLGSLQPLDRAALKRVLETILGD